MGLNMKWFFLALISVIGWVMALFIVPLQLCYRVFSKKFDLNYYFRQIAVGNDVLVGSMIYGSKHTVSAITGQKAFLGGKWHKIQEKVIDFFFGEGHCIREARDEGLINDK